jgi:hypothetical protein
MAIQILSTQSYTEPLTGGVTRTTAIVITGGSNSYLWSVGGLPPEGDLQTLLDAREAELLAEAIAAGVEPNAPEVEERRDFAGLEADIAGELDWISSTLPEIDTGLNAVDAATLAQLRVITRGLLQNQRRILLQQRGELRAWRYAVRRLA